MSLSIRFFVLASVYGIIGMLLGMVMGAKESFTLAPVHAHLNLLGFVALMLFGLVYRSVPAMAASKLAKIHFYVANGGVILLVPSLAVLLMGNKDIVPVLLIGEILTLASLIIFLINLLSNRNA
jgi:cbb3-type cytochrome oxidase subunit 1